MQLYAPTSTTATKKRTRAPKLAKLDGARSAERLGVVDSGE